MGMAFKGGEGGLRHKGWGISGAKHKGEERLVKIEPAICNSHLLYPYCSAVGHSFESQPDQQHGPKAGSTV